MSPLVLILILILLFGVAAATTLTVPTAESGSEESSSSLFLCWRSLGACSVTATRPGGGVSAHSVAPDFLTSNFESGRFSIP